MSSSLLCALTSFSAMRMIQAARRQLRCLRGSRSAQSASWCAQAQQGPLMDCREVARSPLAHPTSDERTARLARDEAKGDVAISKLSLEKFRIEHDALVIDAR